MRVIKSSGVVKDLYFVSSQSDLGNKIIYPKIPDNFLTREKFEEWQTPRIRLYPRIEDCLSGLWLGEKLTGSKLYVYRAKGVRNESLIKPSITSVPYALVLDEYWYLGKLRFEYMGEIEVGNEIEKKLYHYGPRSTKAYIYRWAWKEIGLKPWKTSKINNKNMKLVKKTFSNRLEQREFNSKSMKKLREKLEVLKSQELMDRDNKTYLESARKFLKEAKNSGIPESDPRVQLAIQQIHRTDFLDKVSSAIKNNPNRKKGTITDPESIFIEDSKVLNKKMARSGVNSFEEFEARGGVKGREKEVANRTRGVKKVKGAKTVNNFPAWINKKDELYWRLSPENKEKFIRRRNKKHLSEESIAHHKEVADSLRNKKLMGKVAKKALIGTGIAGGLALGGTLAYKHYKNKKKDEGTKNN